MTEPPANVTLRAALAADRRRIAAGERPTYRAMWTTSPDGSTGDVTVRELPVIHLFVPDRIRMLDGARGLIARTLAVDPASFDMEIDRP